MQTPTPSQLLETAAAFWPAFYSLSVVRSEGAWQASLEVSRGSFRICHGSTPGEALGLVLGVPPAPPAPAIIPPPPY